MKCSIAILAGAAALVAAGESNYTMSTVYATSVYTITSCAATVTDCPARMGSVTTDIISLYTTFCPVAATETKAAPYPTMTPAAPMSTTSTIYKTVEYTISSCPAYVTNCPVGKKTSSVMTQTTVCAVTTETAPAQTYAPSPPASSIITVTSAPAVPASSVPYQCPGGASCPGESTMTKAYGTGVTSASVYSAKPSSATYVPVTGGASAKKAGSVLAVVGVVAAFL